MDLAAFDISGRLNWFSTAIIALAVVLVSIVAKDVLSRLRLWWKLRQFPVLNPEWGPAAQKKYNQHAADFIRQGTEKYGGQPYLLNDYTQSGAKLILHTRYIEELKNHPDLDFNTFVSKDFYANYPGFEPIRIGQEGVIQEAVKQELKQVLGMTIPPMAKELPNSLDKAFGRPEEWKETMLMPSLMRCLNRVTSLVFIGPDLMDNEDWHIIATQYTVDVFQAAQALDRLPSYLRPFLHWFVPQCRRARAKVALGRKLIKPIVKERLLEINKVGKPRKRVLDSVDWFFAAAKRMGRDPESLDYGAMEITLSMGSLHTTTRGTFYLLLDVVEHPEYAQDLRDEFLAILKEHGTIDKSVLYKMKKMDSFIRESQRLHIAAHLAMARVAFADITLSDGIVIPKGTYLTFGPINMLNPDIYPEPHKFDGYRFLRLREASNAENKYQAVTTSAEFSTFGHGEYACPGRFFAVDQIKLVFAYLLLHYEFTLPGGVLPIINAGKAVSPDPRQKIQYKSRTPEVNWMDFVKV